MDVKIKRYVDADMRRILRRVREDQGPDAVILSNRRVADGIEVISAVDYDEALMQQVLGSPAAEPQSEAIPQEAPKIRKRILRKGARRRAMQNTQDKKKNIKVVAAKIQPVKVALPAEGDQHAHAATASGLREVALRSLQSEVSDLRSMLETQLSGLNWRTKAAASPMKAQILRNLTKIGIAPDIANIIVDRLDPIHDVKQHWRAPMQCLANTIPLKDDKLLVNGGVAALIGPTGVGKTTTIAKMASRYAMRFGTSEIALISADAHRIGAQEHLATFANILGVKVYPAEDLAELEALLYQLRNKRLVLIDTEGTGQRNMDLTARLAAYGTNKERVHFYLTLAATCQEAGLDETIRAFNRVPLSGAIITKIDEAAQLGCVLSCLIRHDLPTAFLSDGQRVPDDLHNAAKKGLWLVNQAVKCMRSTDISVNEEMMIEKFGLVGAANG